MEDTGVKLETEDKCGQTEDSTDCEQQVWDKQMKNCRN